MVGAGHRHFAGLQRLTQTIEHLRLELGEFVEEQHALMRERDFAGLGMRATANQCRHRRRMMWRAERAPIGECAARQLAGDRVDERDFEKFARIERRENRWQARREHGFAGAGRSVHQKIVAAGGDFERPLGAFLAFDVAEIGLRTSWRYYT